MEQMYGALRALEQQQSALEEQRVSEGRSVKVTGIVEPLELLALDAFSRGVDTQQSQLDVRRHELLRRISEQQMQVRQAQQRHELLEMLEDKKRAAWKAAADKELDELASDSYLAKWQPPTADDSETTSTGAAA
jgi:predicted transcriptional regulator